MEQDIKVLRKAKIEKILLGIEIVFGVLSILGSLLTGNFNGLLLTIIIVIVSVVAIFYINKKTVAGYQTARTWLGVFFFLTVIGGSEIPKGANTVGIIGLLVILGLLAASALLVNSICKSFETKPIEAPKQNKAMKIIVKVFFSLLGLLILVGIIATIVSYFNGTLS